MTSWIHHFNGAPLLIKNCEDRGLKMPKVIVEAQATVAKVRAATADLVARKDQFTDALIDAIGTGTDPVEDKACIDTLNATLILDKSYGLERRTKERLANALVDAAPELAAQLVAPFTEAVEKLHKALPPLGGLDPLEARDSVKLRASNDAKKLTAVIEAALLSDEIVKLGDLHAGLLHFAGHRRIHAIGAYAVVPVAKAVDYTPNTLEGWARLKPVSAINKGLTLALLSPEERVQYEADFAAADAARRERMERATIKRVFAN